LAFTAEIRILPLTHTERERKREREREREIEKHRRRGESICIRFYISKNRRSSISTKAKALA